MSRLAASACMSMCRGCGVSCFCPARASCRIERNEAAPSQGCCQHKMPTTRFPCELKRDSRASQYGVSMSTLAPSASSVSAVSYVTS